MSPFTGASKRGGASGFLAVSFPPNLHPPEPVLPTLMAAGCVLRPPLEKTKSVTVGRCSKSILITWLPQETRGHQLNVLSTSPHSSRHSVSGVILWYPICPQTEGKHNGPGTRHRTGKVTDSSAGPVRRLALL